MSLIVFEGIDGSGKTTQRDLLFKRILDEMERGLTVYGVIKLAEPTDSEQGKKIRNLMKSSEKRLSFHEELELFMADRRFDVETNIKPALREGKVVLLDRYYFSTAAYQGGLNVLSYNKIIEINEEFAPIPDLIYFFFVPVEIALARIKLDKLRDKATYMEKEENLTRAQQIFKKIHESG
ncbi:MAG: dTMP kinase, partial [Promethearchaeota archaeon]